MIDIKYSVKKACLTIVILININCAFGQITNVTTSGWNIFFAGTGNYVSFNSSGFDPKKIELKLSEGVVQKYYTIESLQHQIDTAKIHNHVKMEQAVNFHAASINKRITMSIVYNSYGKDSLLWKGKYYVIQLPDPTVFIGDSAAETTITREEMLNMYNLGVYMPEFKPITTWNIASYDCQYMPPDGNFKSYHIEKNIFTKELHQQIESCKSGDTFIFRNVKVEGLDSYSRFVNSVIVNIK